MLVIKACNKERLEATVTSIRRINNYVEKIWRKPSNLDLGGIKSESIPDRCSVLLVFSVANCFGIT